MSGRKRTQKQRQKAPNKTCVLKEEKVGKGNQATLYPTRNRICVQKKYSKKDFKQRENRIMTYINNIKSKSPYVIHGGLSSRECCKNSEGIPYIPPRGDYIFLEHIKGSNLTDYFESIFQDVYKIDLGRASSRSSTRTSGIKTIFSNVLEGIEWLHSNGIAHGDIREDNIMWGHRDSEKKKKAIIVDFGAGLLKQDSKQRGRSINQIIRGDPRYSYTGTSNIEAMKTQDYKAVAVIFFRFVNRFMWKLYDNSNRNCYPFLPPSGLFDQSLFESSNNFFNYSDSRWNDTWEKLFSENHILDIKFCNNVIDAIKQTRSIARKQNRPRVSNNKIEPHLSNDKDDTSQLSRTVDTHYTTLNGDKNAEPNISAASSQPVMVGPDSLEHIEGTDVRKPNNPVHGPRKRQSRRNRRRRRRN